MPLSLVPLPAGPGKGGCSRVSNESGKRMQVMLVIRSFKNSEGALGHRLYIGPDVDHLSLAGTLVIPPDLWRPLSAALLAGAGRTGGDLIVSFEGDERTLPRDE